VGGYISQIFDFIDKSRIVFRWRCGAGCGRMQHFARQNKVMLVTI
jgi:hypothetical protein